MTETITIEKTFTTPLGVVRCGLKSDFAGETVIETRTYQNGKSQLFKTGAHQIDLIEFKIRLPLVNRDTVKDALGWIWRIEKTSQVSEQLETFCLFDKQTSDVKFDIATGEHLDAIEAYNKDWTLHIGTEDGEMLNYRAKVNDWFPSRLENKVDFYQAITAMHENGFSTRIPELFINEKLHLQYLAAYDKRDREKTNTWLAVDEFKRNLENWIGIW